MIVAPFIAVGLGFILSIPLFIIEWIRDKIYSGFSFRRKRRNSMPIYTVRTALGTVPPQRKSERGNKQ